MICARCQKPLTRAYVSDGPFSWGPRCARIAGFTKPTGPRKPADHFPDVGQMVLPIDHITAQQGHPYTKAEREHIERVKAMSCRVCGAHGPSECHEIEQGQWFTSVPLCADCHRGEHNGLHGRRHMWLVTKSTELSALNDTVRELMT